VAANDIIARLGGWAGYEVDLSWEEQRGSERWCVIRLRAAPTARRSCSGCGEVCSLIHDCEARRVRDLPIFEVPVELIVPRLRLACGKCGAKLERLEWLEGYSRVTTRLATSVARLCQVMSIRHVARFYRLAWTTVKRIDFRQLQRTRWEQGTWPASR
jgi:transposase